jgi:cell wall-associated NlpC family hydrolase
MSHRFRHVIAALVVALGLTAATAGPAVAAPSKQAGFNSVSAGAAIVREASRHAGKSYRYGATGPAHFDCSGFTMFVFSRFGVRLPHNSGAQSRAVRAVAAAQRRPGDLIFFHTRGGHITHVAIYAGGNSMWHSPHTGTSVRRAAIYSSRVTYGRVR